ncbi:hypothetical protein [Mesoterricola silvestris]|uniref:Transposase n=1 Tax=Mesoterricola silvestris TaxID=2927979 RepID=A0AA48GLB4_9BACT|nr:hypothetical protein METEAL_07340 [Mesoterricola silvestris]
MAEGYWQFFCGEEFFRHDHPVHPTQMTRWRQRIGDKGVEKLLQIAIEAGKTTRTITETIFEKVRETLQALCRHLEVLQLHQEASWAFWNARGVSQDRLFYRICKK